MQSTQGCAEARQHMLGGSAEPLVVLGFWVRVLDVHITRQRTSSRPLRFWSDLTHPLTCAWLKIQKGFIFCFELGARSVPSVACF